MLLGVISTSSTANRKGNTCRNGALVSRCNSIATCCNEEGKRDCAMAEACLADSQPLECCFHPRAELDAPHGLEISKRDDQQRDPHLWTLNIIFNLKGANELIGVGSFGLASFFSPTYA